MHTIVSTLPWNLREFKPGLVPSVYEMEAAPKGGISIKHVGDGYHFVHLPLSGDKTPPMRIVDPSSEIARGFVEDYINSAIFISREVNPLDGAEAIPGLFYVDGAVDDLGLKIKHKDKVERALRQTRVWFKTLIKIADDDWNKRRQHKDISDIQRHAARYLDLKREWDQDILNEVTVPLELTSCFACKTAIPADAIICRQCNTIVNIELYNKKKEHFVLAGSSK